ncbi:unnamed protein product [Kluyveromyces dobzhanskii CBS 2104]|uniref:DNA repair protein RAD5 n=1 Tax=Kluyveromyces dobzhanskii CBS 2104 TaxID=1427455 RepID=A0A0A8L117_9SACH|nr:unnamed protein product [Kluyveromyces dobzhanskii CBS 2104]
MTQEQNAAEKPRFFRDEEEPIVHLQESRPLFVQDEEDDEDVDRSGDRDAVQSSDGSGDSRERFYESLEDLIGKNAISSTQLLSMWHSYGKVENGISIAANEYFEKEEALRVSKTTHNSGRTADVEVIDLSDEEPDDDLSILPSSSEPPASLSNKRTSSQAGLSSNEYSAETDQWSRFIGSIHAIGFTTRPTVKPVPVGSRLGFKKSVPKGVPAGKPLQSQHCSHLIRLVDVAQNRELGRMPEEIARILYPLLNYSDEISLQPFLLSNNDKRFSVGDDIYVRIDCYLTSRAFGKSDDGSVRNKASVINHAMESHQLHRAEAIMALFDAINIKAVYGDTTYEIPSGTQQENNVSSSQFQEEALNVNQLKSFYRITQSAESLRKLPETTPNEAIFKLDLRRYQKQSLSWMLKREFEYEHLSKEATEISIDGNSMNPLWKKFSWPSSSKHALVQEEEEDSKFFYANLYTGEFSTEKPVIKTMINGGILADEMGLGKTISALALICTADYDKDYQKKVDKAKNVSVNNSSSKVDSSRTIQDFTQFNLSQQKHDNYAYKTTLIVVPMSLLNQWHSEFEKANRDPKKRCEIYYGNNIKDIAAYVVGPNAPSVIITTYGVIQSEYSRTTTSGVFNAIFFRIILDEGHTIRNRSTRTSKAVIAMRSSRKWILTGTPIINRLDDLFSLVQFLNLEPWSHINYWKRYVSIPFEKGQYGQAFDVINAVLEPVLLRRTKNMKDVDGKPLVSLPPKEVCVEKLQFSTSENRVYQSMLKDAENSVKEGLAKGDLLRNYTNILVHILRLRQVCCHLDLLQKKPEDDLDLEDLDGKSSQNVSAMLPARSLISPKNSISQDKLNTLSATFREIHGTPTPVNTFECAICTTEGIEPLSAVSITECLHTFCELCLTEYIDFQQKKNLPVNCPYCREPISEACILKLKEPIEPKTGYELISFDSHFQSTKIKALLIHLKQIQETIPGEQIIIFSQFSSFLDILQSELSSHLSRNQVVIYKFDGRLDMRERAKILERFHEKDLSCIKILLLSLKAGGVGLNLTCASRAFMMDPWWSPGMEDQAIDRIHRIGQQKTVKVVRFIIENSVEEKMLKIQEKKRMLGDVVEGDEAEKRHKRIEEIQMLFQ